MDLAKNLKLIIFDFDGTLHSLDLDWQAVRQAVGIHNTNEKLGDAIERFKREKKDGALQAITDLELRAADQQKIEPKITTTLRHLSSNYKLAILSRNSRLAIQHVLENSGLGDILVIGREDVDKLKPDPEGIHKILRQFNLEPNQAILVGDTTHDTEAAQRAGLECIIVGENYNQPLSPNVERLTDFSELEKLLSR